MIRTTVQKNNNVDIAYPKLISFLKKENVGYVAKKSSVFESSDIQKFLSDAEDNDYLALKVRVIISIERGKSI